MPEHFLNEERVRRQLRRRRLSDAQRRKHLRQIDRAIAGREADMDFLKRRSRAEFGVLAAVVALLVLAFVVWNGVLDGGDGDADEPQDALAMANATLTVLDQLPDPTATTPPTPTLEASPTPLPGATGAVCQVDQPVARPPAVVPQGDPSHSIWYGDPEANIWLAPANRAGLLPQGVVEPAGLWFAGDITHVMWFGPTSPVEVTGRRLDDATTLPAIQPTDMFNQIQWTNFAIPTPGCWEITGQTAEESITITVEVFPRELRPDIIYARTFYEARPYEVPTTCPITPWIGPDASGDEYLAHYWFEADGLSADIPGWFLAGTEQVMGVYGEDVTEALSATATRLDGGGEIIEARTPLHNSDFRIARYIFPTAGCWELEMTTPTVAATFVVYVYPEECAPMFENGQIITTCEPPRE